MKTFRKFDRDRDGKLLPDEMLAFWKHIQFLTADDHAGSMRDAGEDDTDYMRPELDDDMMFDSVEGANNKYINWPLQDMHSLRGLCVRVKYPFVAPAYLHCLHYCNTMTRLLRNIRPPPASLSYGIHPIQVWLQQYRVKANILDNMYIM